MIFDTEQNSHIFYKKILYTCFYVFCGLSFVDKIYKVYYNSL